jgi:phosphatidylglycerophosphate synthase
MSFAIGLLAAISFAQVGWLSGVLGALLLQCSAIIDCCDGEVARLKFLESPGGYYLDITCDNVVHVAVFAAIAWSRYRAIGDGWILMLGALAVLGTIISFLIVLTTRHGRTRTRPGTLDRWIDALTTRDFSILLLLLALAGKLEWLLWALAIGVNLFWPIVLGLSWKSRRRAYG